MMGKLFMSMISGGMLLLWLPVNADVLGETDDSYLGFQMAVPLMDKRNNLFSGNTEFSVLLIEKRNGVTDGIAFTHTAIGGQSLAYIKPSSSFRIGQGKVSEYALPVLSIYGQGKVSTNHLAEYNGLDFWIYFVGGTVIIIDKLKDWTDSLSDDDETEETEEIEETN